MSTGAQIETAMTPAGAPQDSLLYGFLRIAAQMVAKVFLDFKCWGVRNVPRKGGVVLVCTHQSHVDPVLYAVNIKRQISYFAKAELFENRYFGAFIRSVHAFPVRRGEADIGAIKEAIRRVKAGHALVVFPEGTRSVDGAIKPLEPGIGLIARRAGVPVIPAVIDGSWKVLPKGAKFPRPQRVRALYGKPLPINGLKPAEIVTLIEKTLRDLQVELWRRMAGS
ncbi:MAG: lysophospholipid acyltransferase family protein [Tepidisphaerales bacterium]